ncbi:adenosine receptor A3-like [Montipora foliosa]|uniref:adenosine receptor A3-like n=1 Tax=Montipora foliosa TaxID=591990 RepID=UPI0035F1D7DD
MDKMANDSLDKQNETLLEGRLTTVTFSPSECIAWLTVLCTIGIAILTVNSLAFIVYLKDPHVRKRSMYLVISLAVADMFVGGVSLSIRVFNSGRSCSLWEYYLSPAGDSMLIAVLLLFPVASVTNLAVISLERMHATFRPFKHRLLKKWIFGASVGFVWLTAVLNSACMWMDKMANDSLDKQNETLLEGRLTTVTFSPSECIAWLTVLCTVGIAIVTVNGLAVIVYLKKPHLRKRSTYLVISLAVADIGTRVITLSIDVFNSGRSCSLWEYYLSPAGDSILIAVLLLFPVVSVINLAVISLERVHATFRPFKHRLLKKWIFEASVAFVWLTAVLNSACIYVLFTLGGEFHSHLSIFACCFSVIVISYMSIVAKMYCGTHPHHNGAVSRERKLTKTLFIVTAVSLAFLLPYILSFFLVFSKRTYYSFSSQTVHLRFCSTSLAYANSLVNPIFYAYRIPEFKRAISSFLGCTPRAQVFPQSDS